ncbi:TPA: hypothetical protein RTH01_001501 [Campylobacter jejuni]|nr:hypothetical protein [Campylobacter jejuni]HDZ5084671.1 hypothetical protein [Campylobacter jejuni]HDZ5097596.1 hypothetical protein [Campylobacter jejuni]
MKKLVIVLGLVASLGINAFAASQNSKNQDQNRDGGYSQEDSDWHYERNRILKEAGCNAISKLSHGRYYCL